MKKEEILVLTEKCKKVRRLIIEEIHSVGKGHYGGSLSIVEVLVLLYNKEMNIDVNKPKMEGRDRLVLSKGHAGPALYATLADKALAAPNFKLNNLIEFVDYNKMQLDGTLNDIVKMDPMDKKWEAFGWFTQTVNGHDLEEIHNAIEKGKKQDKPILIVLDTIKGKGVKVIEESGYKSHSMGLTDEQMKKAIEDLM